MFPARYDNPYFSVFLPSGVRLNEIHIRYFPVIQAKLVSQSFLLKKIPNGTKELDETRSDVFIARIFSLASTPVEHESIALNLN